LAKEKDKMTLNLKPNELPPLHGLPMSFKDQMAVKGFIDTSGYACQLFNKKNPKAYNIPCT